MRRSASLLIALAACSSLLMCTACQSNYKPKGQPIPDGFLINCYPMSECTKSDSTPLPGHQSQQIVVLLSTDPMDKVTSWYKTELTFKGYHLLSDNEVKGTLTLESENDKMHCTINLLRLQDKYTVISISTFPKPI